MTCSSLQGYLDWEGGSAASSTGVTPGDASTTSSSVAALSTLPEHRYSVDEVFLLVRIDFEHTRPILERSLSPKRDRTLEGGGGCRVFRSTGFDRNKQILK